MDEIIRDFLRGGWILVWIVALLLAVYIVLQEYKKLKK